MATLKINVNLDNDAFQTLDSRELEDVLAQVTEWYYFSSDCDGVTLRDSNGNTVGRATVDDIGV